MDNYKKSRIIDNFQLDRYSKIISKTLECIYETRENYKQSDSEILAYFRTMVKQANDEQKLLEDVLDWH